MDRESAKQEIRLLIEKYNRIIQNEQDIKSKEEEKTKKDLILPLFHALGWKTDDSNEVTAEERISKRWVDYGFRISGVPKFFLEAKALGENLDNQKFFEQAVNYAYYKRCPWAVLTNFETIKILNAEWETPYYFSSHFMTIKCNEFLDRFEDLWLLSKEGFELGSLDKLGEKYGKKTKKVSIDKQLLNDFTKFRNVLSKNITKLNQSKKLTQSELDESIQRILDRLIFIRNCEDRGLEEKKLWEAMLEARVWKELKEVFAYYDEHYDSKIFTYDPTDAKKVHLCDTLDIDDGVLRGIIESLYRKRDVAFSYDFSIIDADVLGTVYEQYLSHILKKTEKRAIITENHTHKKEQGIYYTPTYIVNYIVRSTIRELLKDDKFNVENARVLDPACGSGSFLIKAFDVLNEHYRKNDKDYSQTQLDLETGTTFTRKVKILQNNIFGVDLDKQAVEIAQLNLLLKIAEKGHRLPLLERNIRCGNSLIDDESIAGNHAFKWEKEFEEISQTGGFSVVIGNPPYGAELSETERNFISSRYKSASSNKNTALLFIEKSLELINKSGYFGMIVPKSLAFSQLWKSGRNLVKEHLTKVVDVSKAFEDVLLEQMIIILNKSARTKEYVLQDIFTNESISIDKKFIDSTDSIILHGEKKDFEIFKKMNQSSRYLSSITKTSRGLPFQKYLVKEKTSYPIVKGKTISRYSFWFGDEFLPDETVEGNKKTSFLKQPKIMSQRIVAHVTKPKDHIIIMSALDKQGFMNVDTVENTILTDSDYSLEFLLCLLNSKLVSWYAYRYIFSKAIRTMDLDNYYLGKIPLPNIKIDNSVFIDLANRMLSLKKRLDETGEKRTDEYAKIEEETKKTDSEIDEQVYKIHGLTEDEKAIVESSLK